MPAYRAVDCNVVHLLDVALCPPKWVPISMLTLPFVLRHISTQQSGEFDCSGIEDAAVVAHKTNRDGSSLIKVNKTVLAPYTFVL